MDFVVYKIGVDYAFRWNEWNAEHVGGHGVTPAEAEFVVNRARRPWPRKIGGRKFQVWGQTRAGRYLQVIFVIDPALAVFVIHARDLREQEKRQCRRKQP